jgi:hypothetical protein
MQVADALYFSIYLGPCMLLHYRSPRLVIYYSGLFFMSIILAIVRYLLRHTFQSNAHSWDHVNVAATVLTPLTKAGCLVVIWQLRYGFTSLYVATPSLVTASLLLASGAIMGESRFRRRFHTMPQIVLGAATGILSVLAIEISRSNQRGKIPTKHVIAASVTPYTTEHVLGAPPLFAVSSVRSEWDI